MPGDVSVGAPGTGDEDVLEEEDSVASDSWTVSGGVVVVAPEAHAEATSASTARNVRRFMPDTVTAVFG